ncbi:U2 snRNP complex subunit msl1 [Entomortierella beljakovae]|nr:U2 snRNP complex subunit msl1 [Entomortierella beljakovae]
MASTNTHIDPNQTIYVRNLSEKIKKNAYGKVISIVATKTKEGRGQAFIAFSDIVSATTALRGLQGFAFYGKSMEIQYAKSKSHAIAKLDGTYKPPPMKKLGAGSSDQTVTLSAASKRDRDADSDSDSSMSE